MSLRLVPCRSCARHVRDVDARCPFCGTIRGASAVRVAALGASIVLAGCGSTSTPTDDAGIDAATDAGLLDAAVDTSLPEAGTDAADASEPEDASGEDTGAPDAGFDTGGAVPIYGAPPSPGGPRWGGP